MTYIQQRGKIRLFTGDETGQVDLAGRPAVRNRWYWEPNDYDGDMLWSTGFSSYTECQAAAKVYEASEAFAKVML